MKLDDRKGKNRRMTKQNKKEFVKKNLVPEGTLMTTVDTTADIIGISFQALVDCLNRSKNILSTNADEKLQEFLMKAQSYTDDQNFMNSLLNKIAFIRNYGDFSIEGNQLIGKFTTKSETYQLVVTLSDNKIAFENSFEGKQSSALYKKLPSGRSLIQYKDKTTDIFDKKDRKSFNDKYQIVIESYNENGIQESRYIKETHDNYCIMNKTGEKILQYAGAFGNYTEKELTYREENNIILIRGIKKYVPSELKNRSRDKDYFLIGKNIDSNSKKLPIGGNFIWYDKELHEKYLNHEVSIDEVWNLRGDAYQKCFKK